MRLQYISRKEHERILEEQLSEQRERCRETLIVRGRLWDKDLNNYRRRIKELEALGGEQ